MNCLRGHLFCAVVLSVASTVVNFSALAQDAEVTTLSSEERDRLGREEFLKATEAYDQARYSQALKHFERALELSDRAMLHYNIALVHDRLQHDQVALESIKEREQEASESRLRKPVLFVVPSRKLAKPVAPNAPETRGYARPIP